MVINKKYFKEYRKLLGFNNQDSLKKYFAGKDIVPAVDFSYLGQFNTRLVGMIKQINQILDSAIKMNDIEFFCNQYIVLVFEKLRDHNIISKLNNQGRRPEEVYFSWMRGYVISNYFLKALSLIFEVNIENIDLIGDDDLVDIKQFKRTPKADLEVCYSNGKRIRLEIQSGFQGVNDVKQHKVIEAKKIYRESGVSSFAIHFDLFNGQVAFVRLNDIEDSHVNWITRQQMEGQTVFNIDQNYFMWKLTDFPPKFSQMDFD